MSTKGIYTALSGAMAQNEKLETIANNLANVQTTGFKKDQQVFQEYLTAYEKAPDANTVPRVTASIESFYDLAGGDRSYVDTAGTFTDFSQGMIKPTGGQLDIAIEGSGFLEVQTQLGTRMTRNGALTIDNQGTLVTKEGHPVLLEGGGQVKLEAGGSVNITENGSVFQNNKNLGKLSIVGVEPLQALRKGGGSLYSLKENMNPVVVRNPNIKVHQGSLEGSNVNVVKEMTDMIATTRGFETTQKAMKAFDEMDEKLVNSIPQLR
jgi:flagellar basal-body rod protein FlgF